MKLWTPLVPARLQQRVEAVDASIAQSHGAQPAHAWLLKLMREDGPAIVRLLWRALGKEQDVLDAYQECLVRLLGVDAASTPPPRKYAFQTALNIAIDQRRRRKVRQDHMLPVALERPLPKLTSEAPRPSYVELMELLRQAIDALPDRLREVILLHDLAEMNYKDVADVLGLTVGTARVYRHEAITQLSEALRTYPIEMHE